MEYDTGNTLLHTGVVLLPLLACVLHGWFAAAMAAAQRLGGTLNVMAETQPGLRWYLEKKSLLRTIHAAETLFFCVFQAFVFYGYVGIVGDTWKAQTEVSLTGWLIVLPALLTLVLTVLTDGLAKGIGRRKAEVVVTRSLKMMRFMAVLLSPVWGILAGIDRLIGGPHTEEESVTEAEILQMINVGNADGVIEEQQKEMIHNIFEFDDIPISEVMTHRKELVAIDVQMDIAEVVELARNENYSRMPVYQDSIDNIIGVLNTKDLLGLIGCQNITGFTVPYFMREALFVPETAKCDDVLSDMSRKKMQMAIVIDEYGGTAGVVCMEDILEEIVGNIQDEYDEEDAEIHRITDTLFTIDGYADPEDALPALGVPCPENMTFDTMGGFVVDLLGHIPEEHEKPSVQWRNIRFTVLTMEDNWVAKIKAEILPVEKEAEEEGTTEKT